MNRRNFMKLSALVPVTGLSVPVREVRAALTIDELVKAHVIVNAHPTERCAEHFRRSWIGEPFETYGEWYVMSNAPQQLPQHLATMPGTTEVVETRIGESGEETTYLVGAFRRETIAIIVRIIANNENVMLDIGEHIAAQHLPSPFEIAWSDVYLRAFIPDSSDLGRSVEPDDDPFWP